jgi:phosphatidylethanolamine-binding protein (PEBP) family uncharacterized protein
MLEKIPHGLGHALRGVRAGYEKIIAEDDAFARIPDSISLESPAFADGGDIPDRYTADGERISPPLMWRGAPQDAESLVLIIEDPDAPSAEPLVHLLAWDLPPDVTTLDEGCFAVQIMRAWTRTSAAIPSCRPPTCRPIRPPDTALTSTPSRSSR